MARVILLDSPSWKLFDPRMHLHLGILYLAGSLRAAGHDVEVIDCHSPEITTWDGKEMRVNPDLPECDILGLSATTANVNWGSELSREWKSQSKCCVSVLGGPHATHIMNGPHERFKNRKYFSDFDFLMVEECEEAFVAFCREWDRSLSSLKFDPTRVPGIVYWGPFGRQAMPHPPKPDVAKLPSPAFDLWRSGFEAGGLSGPTSKAEAAAHQLTASLYTARGCPYGCTFCADARTTLREETYEQIEAQVEMLARVGVKAVRIQDDTYTIKKERAKRIADILFDHGMYWRGTTRVNLTDPDLFSYLASKNCTELGFGIEHGSDKMLKLMAKGTTAKKNEEGIKLCQDAGIVARAFLMVGFPGETRETIDEMKAWVARVRPSACTLSLFSPYPGSDVWNRPEAYGVTIPDDVFGRMWQLGGEDSPDCVCVNIPGWTPEELWLARKDMVKFLEAEIGSLDRRRLHGNVGTFDPAVKDAGLNAEATG